MNRWILPFVVACTGVGKATDTSRAPVVGAPGGTPAAGATPAGTGTPTTGPCHFSLAWWDDAPGAECGADVLNFCIVDPLQVPEWDFGMVGPAWTGEDCLHGAGATAVCHRIEAPYDTLTQVCAPEEVVAGATTLFDASSDPDLTYYLADTTSCFVWGADTAYYDSLGCDALM